LKIERLPEPLLVFKEGSSTNCKRGLLAGPYGARRDSHRSRILLGLVGPKHLIETSRPLIQRFNDVIESRPIPKSGTRPESVSKTLFPDFPSCPVAFDCTLVIDDAYTAILSLADLAKLDRNNPFSYQDNLLRLIDEKIASILESNPSGPDVLVCLLTNEMYDICHIVGDYHQPLRRKYVPDTQLNLFKDLDDFNPARVIGQDRPLSKSFRSSLKKMVMRPAIRIPVQIVREETLNPESSETQNLATKAWNFCTGVFYKAGNLPWVIGGLNPDTCFLGISFFHKKDFYRDAVFTSMAHLFSNDFDGIVLKGDRVDFDVSLKMPFLDYEKAKGLMERGLLEYEKVRHVLPRQLVIHKTSSFNEGEIRGFSEVLEAKGIVYDLASITKSSLRVLRYGKYPVPRGTLVSFGSEHDFLYTKGFIPELDTYPGVHVPLPLNVKKARGDSSIGQICKDILALTKLNWNTADFCCGLPITVGFARNVGHVFKEFEDPDEFEPQRSYRFYM